MYEGIQVLDRDWRYLYVNAAAAQHGKVVREDLIGNKMPEVYPGIDQTDVFRTMASVMEERQPRFMENLFEYPDGTKCWFDIFIEPHAYGILVRSVDVSQRKSIEEQYWQSQKIETVGRLTGGIAHDFNNKLGVITLFAEMALQDDADMSEGTRESLRSVLEATAQATQLTRQLLAYARRQVLDLRVHSMNDIVKNSQRAVERILGGGIALRVHMAEDISNVRVDAGQIDQILMNLCLNARDAMPGGGTVIVETANIELDAEYCSTRPEIAPGPYVMLSVSDTGVGMTAEIRTRVFEPFFTTKPKGKGTGLGLSMVQGIVAQSHGHIWIYSEPGHGTSVKCYFPTVRDDKEQAMPVMQDKMHVAGDETILLVEDDELLCAAFALALRSAGYKVLTAHSSEQAEIHFCDPMNDISLLLTDIVLPKVSGRVMSESFRRRAPGLKVIFMSGYTDHSVVHKGELESDAILVQKPISVRNLLKTVRLVLDERMLRGVV